MTQQARVQGTVEYRLGDGPLECVPEGTVELDVSETDVTLSWGDAQDRQSAAIPKTQFARYLADKAIALN